MNINSLSLPQTRPSGLRESSRAAKIKCPDCALYLVPYSCNRTIIHKCIKCHGLWFNDKNIAVFRENLAQFDLEDLEIFVTPPDTGSYVIHSCPRCRQVLDETPYGYNSRVNVHRCARCMGIWLPLAEMLHLIQSVRVGQILAPDIRGLLYEMNVLEKEIRFYQNIRWICSLLCTPFSEAGLIVRPFR